jgi:hypothetical protein
MVDKNALVNDLIIIVDHEIQALKNYLHSISDDIPVLFINQDLSAYLLTSTEIDRSHLTRQWLVDTLRNMAPGPVICSDIDLLFEPSLHLDPLFIFRQISRQVSLIILWPGEYKDGTLSYAQSDHQHYHFWRNPEGLNIMGVNDALQ